MQSTKSSKQGNAEFVACRRGARFDQTMKLGGGGGEGGRQALCVNNALPPPPPPRPLSKLNVAPHLVASIYIIS